MTVVHVRMDNRLIHGQILVAWQTSLKLNHIIVCNDQVAKDPMQIAVLKAVAPEGVRVSVMGVKETCDYCLGPEGQKDQIFVLAKYPEDGLGLVENGLDLKVFNLGNQAYVRDSKKVSNTVFLTKGGAEALKKMHEKGIKITCRMMPNNSETEYWPTIASALPDWTK
ncbi:MAG TPA: PTS sugar transporter subunit IIB [Anaerolineales bacterium]|nr:PTS sugar transporter subunit IIB [Anaerolineales bacterium]